MPAKQEHDISTTDIEVIKEYVTNNMSYNNLKLSDSGISFLDKLSAAINSDKCKEIIPLTTAGLKPLQAEVKYNPNDGLRIKRVSATSFIILTPSLNFVFTKVDTEGVFAMLYPMTAVTPSEEDILVMVHHLLNIGSSVIRYVESTI